LTLTKTISTLKTQGKKIVFTNGCFDLLHLGHVSYLAEAKKLGDVLVVGVNSDASVSRLKGKSRPIKDEQSRLAILQNLKMVDHAVLFSEDTPYELIKSILPDVLVKGGDWTVDKIIGAELVLDNGGEVRSLPFIEGYSSTALIDKIKNA
jgi:rfaE bifunctional protein nucleotidyltransferase chain/domain